MARWLETLSEFSYKLEHRAGVKHANADGLSRRACIDCKQCGRVELRDGGPTWTELTEPVASNPLLTGRPVAPSQSALMSLQRKPEGARCGDGQWRSDEPSGTKLKEPVASNPLLTGRPGCSLTSELQEPPGVDEYHPRQSSTDGQSWIEPTEPVADNPLLSVYPVASSESRLVRLQQEPDTAVGEVYHAVKSGQPLGEDLLSQADPELRRLGKLLPAMSLREDGVLMVRVVLNNRARLCAVCPQDMRSTHIWETHRQVHSGIGRTISKLQLHWYWPGMTADVRRAVKTCEICQLGKHGGVQTSQRRHRLFAGRPWQRVAVDLVGPMPKTARGNQWILVLTDHFTRWQDALPITVATTPVVAHTLDERVFCYMGLPEQIHTDQGAQFESELMAELCHLWGVTKTRTTPYHPQANGMVERNNRGLGDSLRTLLLNTGPDDWDLLLPQVMRAFRGTPHSATGETANYMMLGREVRLPDQLQDHPPPLETDSPQQYLVELDQRLQTAHHLLRQQQMQIRGEDAEEPMLFTEGDLVLMVNKRRRKGQNPKLQAKFVGPYTVVACYHTHTYKIEMHGQTSIQSESRLKLYRPCSRQEGQAPRLTEPARRPNMRGAIPRRPPKPRSDGTEVPVVEPLPVALPEVPPELPEVLPELLKVQNAVPRTVMSPNGTLVAIGTDGMPLMSPPTYAAEDPMVTLPSSSRNDDSPLPVVEAPKSRENISQEERQLQTVPFQTTRSGRVSQPTVRFQDFAGIRRVRNPDEEKEWPKLVGRAESQGTQTKGQGYRHTRSRLDVCAVTFAQALKQSSHPPPSAHRVNLIKSVKAMEELLDYSMDTSMEDVAGDIHMEELTGVRSKFPEAPKNSKVRIAHKPIHRVAASPMTKGPCGTPVRINAIQTMTISPTTTKRPQQGRPKHQKRGDDSFSKGPDIVNAAPSIKRKKVEALNSACTHPECKGSKIVGVPTGRWLTHRTQRKLEAALKASKVDHICKVCELKGKDGKAMARHLPQHFLRVFCQCGKSSNSRDMMLRHQRQYRGGELQSQHGGVPGQLYEVDMGSYTAWCHHVDLQQPSQFGECLPTTIGKSTSQPRTTPSRRLNLTTSPKKKTMINVAVTPSPPPMDRSRPVPVPVFPSISTNQVKEFQMDLNALEQDILAIRRAASSAENLYSTLKARLPHIYLINRDRCSP